MSWTNILTHNLTTGAACCAAFHDGIDESQQHDLYHRHGYRTHQCWSPGCGKPSVEEVEVVEANCSTLARFYTILVRTCAVCGQASTHRADVAFRCNTCGSPTCIAGQTLSIYTADEP